MYLLNIATVVSMTKQICDYLKRKCRNVKLDNTGHELMILWTNREKTVNVKF